MSIGKSSGIRVIGLLCALLVMTCLFNRTADAQPGSQAHPIHLGIIVTSTAAEAQHVLNQLQAGMDFSILAKEVSIDATATDGGYMGDLNPDQLRADLRSALSGRAAGQITDIVQIPSGFAILKVLPAASPVEDINPKRISSLVTTGAIRYGASVAGLVEANAILQDYPKPVGWDHNLHQVCQFRKESLAAAEAYLRDLLDLCLAKTPSGCGLSRTLYPKATLVERSGRGKACSGASEKR
jgi:hypothetical protein